MTTIKSNKKTIRRDITNFNSAYWQMRQFWIDALNLKEPLVAGGITTGLALYLNRYAKEDDGEFAQRIKRLAQVNFVDLVIDAYCSMLFSTDIRITAGKHQDRVDKFVNSCNEQGDTLKEFCREMVAPASFLYGIVDVFVDLPSVGQEIQSQEQAREAGLDAPYCYMVPPLNRVAWSLDDARNYTIYRSQDIINQQLSAGMQVKDKHQYNEWTLKTVDVYDSAGGLREQRDNPFGFIPAVSFVPLPSMRFYDDRIGLSLVQDVLSLQKLILNLISLILDFHESVNFGMRVLIQDTTNDDEPPTQGELEEGGNKRGLILKGSGSDYKILTPDAAGVEAMCRFLDQVIERAWQSVRIPSDSNMNKTHQSRGTIRGNMAPLYNRLTRISKHFEKAMRQLIEMALRVQGIDPAEAQVQVQWGTNFAFESFATAIEELTAARNVVQDIAPTAVAELTRKTMGAQIYDSEKIGAVNDEIDKWVEKQNTMLAQPPEQPGTQPDLQKQNTEINAAAKIDSDEGT